MEMVEFVQAHSVLFAKEYVHYFDKVKKDRLREEIGRRVGRSGQDVKRWFESKLTRDQAKSGSGRKFQRTERTKKRSSGDWGVLTDQFCYINIPERVQRLPYRCG